MSYYRNGEVFDNMAAMHGKYLLRTTLDSQDKINIWTFYHVIRTVEKTFKTLKPNLISVRFSTRRTKERKRT